MNIFNELRKDIIEATKQICSDEQILSLANIEIPKDYLNGDLATNIAMIIASKENLNPKEVGIKIKNLMANIPYIAHIEVAGPGFINFTIKADKWHDSMRKILSEDSSFYEVNIGEGKKVNIEYVSANPTGPLHIGHARGAVYGDALAKLLEKAGYNVTREYYVNDAGAQVDDLISTVFLRYKEIITKEKINIPEGLYPGEYLIEVGANLVNKFGDKLLNKPESERNPIIKEFAIDSMIFEIKKDLENLGIKHDIFFSEQSLHDTNAIDKIVEEMQRSDMIYVGTLPPPKGKEEKNWIEREQLLLRSTKFGDDQDRPLKKGDGSWAYFASDLAYAKDKIDRGFEELIFILGADHSGYVKRIEAIVNAIGNGKIKCDIKICQLVNFVENDIPVKMSKRAGVFTKVREVTDEVGSNVIRFMMLTRKNDAPLDFDLKKVQEQSSENPVFYVQYAFVRTKSILANCKQNLSKAYDKFESGDFDLSLLSSEEEIQLIKLLSSYPKIIESAAKHFEPHRIAFYLLNVAAKFHSIWNLGKENNDYRFVIEDDIELTIARLAMVKSVQKIILTCFDLIGVEPLEQM